MKDWDAILKNYDYPKRPCDSKCVDNCPARSDCPLYQIWLFKIKKEKKK